MNPSYQIGDLVNYHDRRKGGTICVIMDMGTCDTGTGERNILVVYSIALCVYYLVYEDEIDPITKDVAVSKTKSLVTKAK